MNMSDMFNGLIIDTVGVLMGCKTNMSDMRGQIVIYLFLVLMGCKM